MPIVGNNEAMVIGKILSRHEVRSTIQFVQTMSRAEAELAPDLKPKSEGPVYAVCQSVAGYGFQEAVMNLLARTILPGTSA
jgi:hypothetical protein